MKTVRNVITFLLLLLLLLVIVCTRVLHKSNGCVKIVAHVAALFGECRVAVVDLPQVLRGAPAAVDALGGWLGAAPLNASAAERVAAHAAHYSTPSWRGGDHGGTHGEFLSAPALARLREFYARDQATLKAIKKARRGGVPRACTEVDRLIEM